MKALMYIVKMCIAVGIVLFIILTVIILMMEIVIQIRIDEFFKGVLALFGIVSYVFVTGVFILKYYDNVE